METGKNVFQRLAAAMEEVTYIRKEQKRNMQYTIVSHDAVTAKVRPVLLKHGIVYYPVRCEHKQDGNRAECSMTVRFVNVDAPTDYFEVPTFGYGIDPQDKGPGKAMSYAVKYALLKALGLETGDDPDTDDADFKPEDKSVKQPTPKPQDKTAQRQEPSRQANSRPREYTLLADDMKRNKSSRDLVAWWKDGECKQKRGAMTEALQQDLYDAFCDYGHELKAQEQRAAADDDGFPGSMSDREASQHPMGAG